MDHDMGQLFGLPARLWTLVVWFAAICATAFMAGVVLPIVRGDPVLMASVVGAAAELAIVVVILVCRARTPLWFIHLILVASLIGATVAAVAADSVDGALFAVVNAVLVVLYAGWWWHGRVAYAYATVAAVTLLVLVIPNRSFSIHAETWLLLVGLLAFESYCISMGVRRIQYTSTHDSLTGRLNTTALHAYIAIQPTSGRAFSPRTLVSIDLNDLKSVNDSLGHQAGDTLLRECSSAWAATLRPDDLLFRVGGDEFVIVLPQTEPDAASSLIERLRDAYPVRWAQGRTAWIPGESFDTALARADSLMYEDKRRSQHSRDSAVVAADDAGPDRAAAVRARSQATAGGVFRPARTRSTPRQTTLDALTGLITDGMLSDRIAEYLSEPRLEGERVDIAFLGLDRFERINQSLGMRHGDELLVQVSQRLSDRIRPGDTLARFSGDEFVVVMTTDVDDDAVGLGKDLLDCFVEPFPIGGNRIAISASVGLSSTVGHPEPDDLLEDAASAMIAAKGHGGNRVQTFDQATRDRAVHAVALETDLSLAVAESEIVVHYQPVIDLDSGTPVGVEALARWERDGVFVPPGEFIPVAEASGLILTLGRRVLNQACHDAVRFSGPSAGFHVAVNLSTRELMSTTIVDDVRAALGASGLEAGRLFLEITESALMQDEALAGETLDALTDMGVGIAVDDFGTGYSSLLYLRRYPITVLKVDQAFVGGIGTSADDEAICRSVLGLAQSLNLRSVAEGVETQAQADVLRAYGCKHAQGFLWSPAVPFAQLNAALDRLPHALVT